MLCNCKKKHPSLYQPLQPSLPLMPHTHQHPLLHSMQQAILWIYAQTCSQRSTFISRAPCEKIIHSRYPATIPPWCGHYHYKLQILFSSRPSTCQSLQLLPNFLCSSSFFCLIFSQQVSTTQSFSLQQVKHFTAIDREQYAIVKNSIPRNVSFPDRNVIQLTTTSQLLNLTAPMKNRMCVYASRQERSMHMWINVGPYLDASKGRAGPTILLI